MVMSNVKSRTLVKICGLSRMEDIQYVNEVHPDYIGLVFAKSKRQVTKEQAKQLVAELEDSIIPVGVFVNERPEVVMEYLREGIIQVAQLHGQESEEEIQRIKQSTKKKVIKAIQIESAEDISRYEHSVADYLLLDSGKGSGVCFDWNMLVSIQKPFFLAGGLNCENVKEAIDKVHPMGVDVSSGVEENGVKSKRKIQTFIEKVRKVGN